MINERFRFNRGYILVLSLLFQSFAPYCYPEFIKDTSRNTDSRNYLIAQQSNSPDPSIERIFQGPVQKCNQETNKDFLGSTNSANSIRIKRENTIKKNNPKVSNEAVRVEEKRELSSRSSKSSRTGRSSKDQSNLKQPIDYELTGDQEYIDEAEDEPAAGPRGKQAGYKDREQNAAEDKFTDQGERANLYDEFESKDVAKRGVSGAEDYEEIEEDSVATADEIAALDEQDSLDENSEKEKVRGDARVKRDQENSKESISKESTPADPKDTEYLKEETKELPVADSTVVKDSSELREQSRSNLAEKLEKDESKVRSDRTTSQIDGSENGKSVNEPVNEKKVEEEANLSNEKRAPSEASSLEEPSKLEEPKMMEVQNVDTPKDVSGNMARDAGEEVLMLDSPGSLDDEYEKHVEEQIQQKIDSIKEEIKREIAEKQRIREIEVNNAKFDELREEDDEEQAAEVSENGGMVAKRSPPGSGRAQIGESAEKRSIKRRKRHDEAGQKRFPGSAELQSSSDKKSNREKRRSAPLIKSVPKKDVVRQVFLVRNDRSVRKKRKRRSKDSTFVPEQKSVKLENNQPADLESNLREDNGDSKQQPASYKVTDDEKAIAEGSSLLEKKSGSVASLTGSNEELGPLATEYGEAFGGLHGEPGVALARFKRIKRVLRPPKA